MNYEKWQTLAGKLGITVGIKKNTLYNFIYFLESLHYTHCGILNDFSMRKKK